MSGRSYDEAPLFVRTYDLHSWLLDHDDHLARLPRLRDDVLGQSSRLLDAVTLALKGFDVSRRVVAADAAAALLRVHLRLAADKHLLTHEQHLFAAGELDDVGRQLGGWRRKLA